MKKNIVLIFALIISVQMMAQRPNRAAVKEKIKAIQIAVFTETLDLTAREAEKFWPIYNEHEKKLRNIDKQIRELGKGMSSKTDKEIEQAIEKRFEFQEKKIELERASVKKFKTAIPMKKIAKIPLAQREFKRRLVIEMKNRKEKHRRGGQ